MIDQLNSSQPIQVAPSVESGSLRRSGGYQRPRQRPRLFRKRLRLLPRRIEPDCDCDGTVEQDYT